MSHVFINEEYLSATADAIREKIGGGSLITPSKFADNIRNIQQDYTPVAKGLVINQIDPDGYPADVSIVGFTTIPKGYCRYLGYVNTSDGSYGYLSKIGDNLHIEDCTEIIDSYAFYYCNNFKNLTLPDNIKELGIYCFYYCTALTMNTLPQSLERIGSYAFSNCTKLNLPSLPDSLKYIGDYAFGTCSSLIDLSIPDSVTTIGINCFYNCSGLKTLKLPKHIQTLANYLCSGDTNLESVVMPDTIKTIGTNCFNNCPKLTIDKFNFIGTSIPTSAFNGCAKLKLDNLNDDITSIGSYAFSGCTALDFTKLPASLNKLDSYCFQNCTNLKITELPEGVTSLPTYAFYGCAGITSLKIKGDITTINNYTFSRCSNLNDLYLPNITKVPSLSSTNAFTTTPIASKTGSIWVPHDLIDSMKTASNWKTYADTIKGIELESLYITNNYINSAFDTNTIVIAYNGSITRAAALGEYAGYTLSVEGNATLEGDVLTLTDNAQEGDVITITATSTYNPEITTTKELVVINRPISVDINLNDGEWEDTGTNVNGHTVYRSNYGSYYINEGKSIATITTTNIKRLTLYIRSYGYGNDYTEAFEIDTPAERGKGKYTTYGKQSQTAYTKCTYNIGDGVHTIDIMYSKDSATSTNDDRGYFYIESYEYE